MATSPLVTSLGTARSQEQPFCSQQRYVTPKPSCVPHQGTCPPGAPSTMTMAGPCCQRTGPGQSWQELAWGQPGCPGGTRSPESAQPLPGRVVPVAVAVLTQRCGCQVAPCQACDWLQADAETGLMAEGWQVPGSVPISVPSPSQEPHPHAGSFPITGDWEWWHWWPGRGARTWRSYSGVAPVCPQQVQGCHPVCGRSPAIGSATLPSRQRGRGGQDGTRTGKSPVSQLARASLMGHTMTGTHLTGLGSVAAWDRL